MPQLASHQSPDITSTSRVLFVAQDARHQGVPEISNFPEIHVWVIGQGRREAETGKRGDDDIKRVCRVATECAGIRKRINDLGPMPEGPWPTMSQDQWNRIRADTRFAHEMDRNAIDVHLVM